MHYIEYQNISAILRSDYITVDYYLRKLIGMLWKLMVIIPERGGFVLKTDKTRKPNQRFGFSH